jgi:hypothetical protein
MSLSFRDDIVTSRLTLIAITPEMLLSEKNGDGRLGELIQCVIPPNWPHKDWSRMYSIFCWRSLRSIRSSWAGRVMWDLFRRVGGAL